MRWARRDVVRNSVCASDFDGTVTAIGTPSDYFSFLPTLFSFSCCRVDGINNHPCVGVGVASGLAG